MKKAILTMLKAAQPEYISGEEISSTLKVSRTAIWKHINILKDEGYIINSQPKKGYQLQEIPDKLYPEEITDGLTTEYIGQSVVYFESTGSTNNIAKELVRKALAEGTIVIAEEQTEGKGRLGREWISPKGEGIWLSVILRPNIRPIDATQITLAAAVATVKAIFDVTGLRLGIKWPNDILFNGKKVVGILTEMNAEVDRINFLVLGIGMNVNNTEFPDDISSIATSLRMINEEKVNRINLLQSLLKRIEEQYKLINKGEFQKVIQDWKEWNITIGQEVAVTTIKESISGRAVDINEEGALILKLINGELMKVLSGDVTLRPKIK